MRCCHTRPDDWDDWRLRMLTLLPAERAGPPAPSAKHGQDHNQLVGHFISHDERRNDELSRSGNTARSSKVWVLHQRCDSLVDTSRYAVRRCRILVANVGDDFIEFRQSSNGPNKLSHLHLDVRRRPLGLGNTVAVPRERSQAIACSWGTTRALGLLASSSALRM